MNPYELLLQDEDTINLIVEHGYVPQSSSEAFGRIIGALKLIEPNINIQTGCSGCISEIAKQSWRHLKKYKENNPEPPKDAKFFTFPLFKK